MAKQLHISTFIIITSLWYVHTPTTHTRRGRRDIALAARAPFFLFVLTSALIPLIYFNRTAHGRQPGGTQKTMSIDFDNGRRGGGFKRECTPPPTYLK